jgi:hypothetical protein
MVSSCGPLRPGDVIITSQLFGTNYFLLDVLAKWVVFARRVA